MAASSLAPLQAIVFFLALKTRSFLPSLKKEPSCTRNRAAGRPLRSRPILASAATIGSGNGAVSAPLEKPSEVAPYGRQYFPLTAVVGQMRKVVGNIRLTASCKNMPNYDEMDLNLISMKDGMASVVIGCNEDSFITWGYRLQDWGIAISGKHRRAKTVMACGLHAMLPLIEVVAGSIANVDPNCPEEWEDGLADQVEYDASGNIRTEIVKTPFEQLQRR